MRKRRRHLSTCKQTSCVEGLDEPSGATLRSFRQATSTPKAGIQSLGRLSVERRQSSPSDGHVKFRMRKHDAQRHEMKTLLVQKRIYPLFSSMTKSLKASTVGWKKDRYLCSNFLRWRRSRSMVLAQTEVACMMPHWAKGLPSC
jgi:hypothetical protein